MLLLLLRHADAEPRAATDRDRRLTEKGRDQAERVGRFCAKRGLHPELVMASPYRRAAETAAIVAGLLGAEVQEAEFLGCGMNPERAIGELRGCGRFGTVLWVGHQPDFGELIARLLGGAPAGAVRVRKASLAGFEIDPARPGDAELQFFVPAQLM